MKFKWANQKSQLVYGCKDRPQNANMRAGGAPPTSCESGCTTGHRCFPL